MENKIVHSSTHTTQGYLVAGCTFHFLLLGESGGGSSGVMEILVPPGVGPNLHIHHDEEEQFYVLEGDVVFTVGGQTIHAHTGDFIHIPRGTAHGFQNGDSTARLLALYIPGGLEKSFLEEGKLV